MTVTRVSDGASWFGVQFFTDYWALRGRVDLRLFLLAVSVFACPAVYHPHHGIVIDVYAAPAA